MDFRFEDKHKETLRDIHAYLDGLQQSGTMDLEQVARDFGGRFGQYEGTARDFIRQLGKDGWLGLATPKQYGGQGRSYVEQWLFHEELEYRRLPTGAMLTQAVIPTVTMFASEEMKARFLPLCLTGQVNMAIAYSEPNAGTDLAALSTRAERVEEGYKLNGQKIWCSHGHTATHLWLAARTGAPDSRHKGISLFIVPTDVPGIEFRPIITQLGERLNEVFFDDAVIPADCLLGEENDGWKYIMGQLNFERVFLHAQMRYELEQVAIWLRENRQADLGEYQYMRRQLAKLAADVHVSRLMGMRTAWMMDNGITATQVEASVSKIINTETHQRVGIETFKIAGNPGQLALRDPKAPGKGRPMRAYLSTPAVKFGGGTNELQRDLIAGFGLGMPRTR